MDGALDPPGLSALRAQIDAIDAELVGLLARRLDIAGAIAALKPGPGQIVDAARSRDVIARVRTLAGHAGLAPDAAEQVWRAVIAASVDHQARLLERKRAGRDARPSSRQGKRVETL